MSSKSIRFLMLCLMPLCVQAYEKVHFTENGLTYSSVLPAACGHYLGRCDSTDVMIRGYESPELFDRTKPLRIANTVTHDGRTYSVVRIGEQAFAGLQTVEKIVVDEGIEEVNSYAFACMPNLKSVCLPATMNALGRCLFYGSDNLKEVVVNPESEFWASPDDCNAILSSNDDDESWLYVACSATTIPATVKVIKEDAFSGCRALERLVVPEGVEVIESLAFSGCSNLREVVLPESLKEIGYEAFADCVSLESVFIPKNVSEIRGNLFKGCHRLTSVVVDKDNPYYDSRSSCNGIVRKADSTLVAACKATVITKDIGRLGDGCFCGINIHSLRIPKTLKEVSGQAFYECDEIDEITVEPKNPYYTSPEGSNVLLTKDGKTLVLGCRTSEIPEGIEKIERCAFWGRFAKHLLQLPEGLRTIGRNAFAYCGEINSIVFPSSLKEMDEVAFQECDNLWTVQFLAPLEKIEYATFRNCKNLTSINFPEGMKVIGHHAFEGCSELKDVCLPSSITEIENDAFRGCPYQADGSDK